jgi:hypothetical protein
VNVNTAVHLLLTAEFLWITLYILALVVGLLYDNISILSLTFFFLVLSAVEFGLGLILILMQSILTRSTTLNNNNTNALKFSSRFSTKLHTNAIQF